MKIIIEDAQDLAEVETTRDQVLTLIDEFIFHRDKHRLYTGKDDPHQMPLTDYIIKIVAHYSSVPYRSKQLLKGAAEKLAAAADKYDIQKTHMALEDILEVAATVKEGGKMFIVIENTSRGTVPLEHTVEETAEKCFWAFVDGSHETNLKAMTQVMADNESLKTLEEFYDLSSKELKGQLFDVWDGGDSSRIFSYSGEPDWNEMLEHRYRAVNTPHGYKQKYFIAEVASAEGGRKI